MNTVTVSEALLSTEVSRSAKVALLDLLDSVSTSEDCIILKPRASNDDVDGSQHAHNGGTDFTYEDATLEDLNGAETLGHYEYFSREGDHFTGHYYQGEGYKFAAVVVDPPAYAALMTI